MNEFRYFYRQVYGLNKIYPGNEVAAQFANLLGVKTFSASQIHQIEELGFLIFQVRDPKAFLVRAGAI